MVTRKRSDPLAERFKPTCEKLVAQMLDAFLGRLHAFQRAHRSAKAIDGGFLSFATAAAGCRWPQKRMICNARGSMLCDEEELEDDVTLSGSCEQVQRMASDGKSSCDGWRCRMCEIFVPSSTPRAVYSSAGGGVKLRTKPVNKSALFQFVVGVPYKADSGFYSVQSKP